MLGAARAATTAARASAERAPATEGSVMKLAVGDGELSYDSRGSGPALLLLHAFPLDRRMWSEELARLSDVRRVITVDLRGFGESPLWGRPTVDDFADDIARVLDGLGIPMASI